MPFEPKRLCHLTPGFRFLGAVLAMLCFASAQSTTTWVGGTGNWSSATLWSTGAVPSSGDSVLIDGGNAVASSVSLNNSATVSQLGVSLGDTLIVPDGKTLTFSNAGGTSSLAVDGTLSLDSSYYGVHLSLSELTLTLSGAGTVSLSNHAGNIITGSSSSRLVNQTTVRGSGQIGSNMLGITNSGTLLADRSTPLIIDPSSAGLTNTGTLRASSGATLRLQDGSFNNDGGRIESHGSNSIVSLNSASISGGTLASTDGGKFLNQNGSTLSGSLFEAGSLLENPDSATLYLSGNLTNQGALSSLASYYGSTWYVTGGNFTLKGTGTLQFSNYSENAITGGNASWSFINEANTIVGAGRIGSNAIGFLNRGTVVASGSQGLVLDPASTNSVTNAGILKAASGGILTLSSGVFLNSEGATAGTIRAEAGGIVSFANASVTGGAIATVGNGELRLNASSISGATLTNSSTGVIRTSGGSSDFGQGSLNNPAGGQLIIADSTSLQFNATGTYINAGTLQMSSSYYGATLYLTGGDVVLGGGGVLSTTNHGNNIVSGKVAGDRLVNTDLTIQGSGSFGNGSLGIINRGTIQAIQSVELNLHPSSQGIINSGLLSAQNGATLRLSNASIVNYEGAVKGLITAQTGSLIAIHGTSIQGGLLSTSGTGRIRTTAAGSLIDPTLTSGSVVEISDGTALDFTGTVTNNGTFASGSTYYGSTLRMNGDVTLTGGGAVTLSNHGNNIVTGASTSSRLINVNNSISGAGQLGNGSLGLVNSSLISATSSVPLIVNPGTGSVINTGIMEAAGGILRLSGSYQNYDGALQGLIRAVDTRIETTGASITGGQLQSSGTGYIVATGSSTFSGISLLSGTSLRVLDGIGVTFRGDILNDGAISSLSTYYGTTLTFDGAAILRGTGTLELSNHGNNTVSATSGSSLTLIGQTLRGGGSLGNGLLTLFNQGSILADQSTALTIDLAAPLSSEGILRASGSGGIHYNESLLTNRGQVIVDSGSHLQAAGQYLQTQGSTELLGGTLSATSFDFSAGLLSGSGNLQGAATNAATFQPGSGSGGIGTLAFNSTLAFSPTSQLLFDIAGTAAGTSFDQITATSFTLGGFLKIKVADSFLSQIQPVDSFTLLQSNSGVSGTFTDLINGAPLYTVDGKGFFTVTYTPLAVTLSQFQAVPEPPVWLLLASSLGLLFLRRREH